MEKELKNTRCSWWEALFTLGIACIIKANIRNKLAKARQEHKTQFDLASSMAKRLTYFDGVKKIAGVLTEVATKEADS